MVDIMVEAVVGDPIENLAVNFWQRLDWCDSVIFGFPTLSFPCA
jgi:hypothetical protein